MTLIPDALALVRELIPNSASQLFLHATQAADAAQEGAVPIVLPPPNGYFHGDAVDLNVAPHAARTRARQRSKCALVPPPDRSAH